MHFIMINGPCGVGKSRTAQSLHSYMPNSELIQTDGIRKHVPAAWFEGDAALRMEYANVIGRGMAGAALSYGKDVIVEGLKYQEEWIDPWIELGNAACADVVEVCITAPKEVVIARAAIRGYMPHGRLTPEKVDIFYDKVIQFYEKRPQALIISNEYLTSTETAREILTRTGMRQA